LNGMEPRQLALTLGIPLFQTSFFLPGYPDGEWGPWRISHTGTCISPGYYTRQWIISAMPVLLRRNPQDTDEWETWMSLTPHEIESQEPGCLYARGHTAIMGLGMGWIAVNAALNPNVLKVTVVERDEEVINLFAGAGVLEQTPPEIGAKINIIHGDALDWRPREPVEFLFADIWRTLAEPDTPADVRSMQRKVRAESVYFWGQELWLHSAFQRLLGPEAPLTPEGLKLCIKKEIGLPLVLPWGAGYVSRIAAAIENRRDRGLIHECSIPKEQ
jgi:hypothetical protein